MHAQVREARDLVAQPHDHELLVEQRHRQWLVRELRHPAHRLPAPPQGPMQARFSGLVEMDVGFGGHQSIMARRPNAPPPDGACQQPSKPAYWAA